jgi:hypothetical protein
MRLVYNPPIIKNTVITTMPQFSTVNIIFLGELYLTFQFRKKNSRDVRPNVNQEMKMAALMLSTELKMGMAFETTNVTSQKAVPMPIQRAHVNVLWTFTSWGLIWRIMVTYMYCLDALAGFISYLDFAEGDVP